MGLPLPWSSGGLSGVRAKFGLLIRIVGPRGSFPPPAIPTLFERVHSLVPEGTDVGNAKGIKHLKITAHVSICARLLTIKRSCVIYRLGRK